jgi:GTPase SAR1 family protein
MEVDPIAKQAIKIVAVGDHLVGKSCAIERYACSNSASSPASHLYNATQLSSIVNHARSK